MAKTYQGRLVAEGLRFALVVSRFNEFVTRRLLDGAVDALVRHGAADDDLDVVWVPGTFEIPVVARRLAASGRYHAVVCLGAVIRGGTSHWEYIASQVARGVSAVGLETGVPTVFGVLTADSLEQAIERAGGKGENRGAVAAQSAIEMATLLGDLASLPGGARRRTGRAAPQ
jgi:6,7-dimethyl-8-ribityllumazine synthase